MKKVSGAWTQAIYAKTRQTKVSITFPFVDPDAKDAAEINILPSPSEISKAEQIVDDTYDMVGKLAQFEPNYWKLDGTFILPLTHDKALTQHGYWSEILSNSNANFPQNMVMRLFFNKPVTVPGITIVFDKRTNNYLTDFDLIAYDQNLQVLRKEEIRGNAQAHFILNKGVVALKYIDIVFLKSSLPNRRVRITEIDFGIVLVFEGANLFTANLISESNPLAEALPSNELNFTALNNGNFDYTNPESYSKYLQRRQQFEYRHILMLDNGKRETVEMGTYSLQSWNITDSQISIKASLDLSALEEHSFRCSSLNRQMTCGQLLDLIFSDAGWSYYEIDKYLYGGPMLTPFTGEVSSKEALRMVAQLAGAAVYKMPDGKIIVKRMELKQNTKTVDVIDYNNSFSSTQAKSSTYYNTINLAVNTVSQKETPQGKPIARHIAFPQKPNVAEKVWVRFDYALYDDSPQIQIVSAGTSQIISYILYANYALVEVKASTEYVITITGKTLDLSSSADLVYYAPWYQEGEELQAYNLKLPMVFQGAQHNALHKWCVNERFRVLGCRLETESKWRHNPALDIGDYVNIQMDKSDKRVPVLTTKHSISYSGGALSGTTTGIGQGQLTTN